MSITRRLCRIISRPVKKAYLKVSSLAPFPYSFGIKFSRKYKWLMESQWYSREQLIEFQLRSLKKIIDHAYQNVPYYRRIFDERGVKPKDIQDFTDLEKLPVLTKNDIRNHFEELTARNYRKFNPSLNHTSGSTGEPLSYYIDKDLAILISACVQRHWHWCGVGARDRIAVFRGTLIDDFGTKINNHWKRQGNQLHFSTFDMKEEVISEYVKQLNNWKPNLVRGYPSSLEILSRFISEQGLKVYRPKAIHTSSETVMQNQREVIEKAFGSPLFDWYGHGESTVNAGECDKHEGLHLGMEFGYTEFIKTPETQNMDGIYNIISTSLHNYSMPFVRYDSEDLALLGNENCSCGRGLLLIKEIIGRQADIIEGINGVKIAPSSFVHFWKYRIAERLSNISYAQIIQRKKATIKVRLVGEKREENEKIIIEQLHILLGNMQIEFEYLYQIPTGQKWRFTVSEIL
jgi:phenylacetate-CoA ligase